QTPLFATSLQRPTSWSGTSVQVDGSGARLQYREVEADGFANINCRKGSLRFWFKPNWSSTASGLGSGPGATARLIEMGNSSNADRWWVLSITANGNQIVFESQTDDSHHTAYFSQNISWTANKWHQIVVAYSSSQ